MPIESCRSLPILQYYSLISYGPQHWIAAPPAREKYIDSQNDQIMLEDESGRIRLCGGAILSEMLVTGCVISVMGSETADGDFEVIDLLFPGLPPQLPDTSRKGKGKSKREGKYVAIASGLKISGELHESFETHLLVEYLLGELTGVQVRSLPLTNTAQFHTHWKPIGPNIRLRNHPSNSRWKFAL